MLSRGWWWALFHTETHPDGRCWILQLRYLEYVTFLVATEGERTWRTVPRFLPFPYYSLDLLNSTGCMTPCKSACAKKCWEELGIFDEHYYFCYSWITSFTTQLTTSENLLHMTLEFHSVIHSVTGFSLPSNCWEFLIHAYIVTPVSLGGHLSHLNWL